MDWNCHDWCSCYPKDDEESRDDVYEQMGCLSEVDDTTCHCASWGEAFMHASQKVCRDITDKTVCNDPNVSCFWSGGDVVTGAHCLASAVNLSPLESRSLLAGAQGELLPFPSRCETWCTTGKACGNSCINKDYNCGTPETREGANNLGRACDTNMYDQQTPAAPVVDACLDTQNKHACLFAVQHNNNCGDNTGDFPGDCRDTTRACADRICNSELVCRDNQGTFECAILPQASGL